MGADRNRIDELARAVAQRTKVAWDDEMRSAEDGTDQAIIAQLETVERIIEAHWGLPGNVKNLGDFEIIEEIGRGGMGVVYKARQTSLDRYVAVKVLSWDFVSSEVSIARFEREAKALAALEHPNIVGVHSVDRVDDLHFISMELVEGDALSSVIPEHGMKLEDMLDIAVPLADALSFAHEHGVVHRDFKPANVMIDQTRRPKVLDFGLARLRRENRLSSDARKVTATFDTTEKSSLLGTVPYMSPEQAEGQELDHRTDIFSLGVVLYEMATGRRPFDGSSPASVISSIVNDCHPPVRTIRSELPRDLERIIFHCLRKNPEQRYQTAKGLRNELEELAKRIELEQFKPKPPRRSAWWKAIAVAVAFLTLVVFLDEIIEKISEMFPPPVETERAKYLAVLPFDVLGQADEDMETISLGLNEVLTTKLNQLTATQYLQVATPSPTSFSPSATTRDVGVSLGANLLVTGTILRLDMDNVRFTVNLFDLDEEIQSQTRTVDTDLKNPFTLQDRIVTAVVAMIELELDARERGNLLSHGTKSAAPEWAYLQALGLLTSHLCSGAQGWCNDRIENTDKAISLLQQAIDEDSDHAEALALLGTTYWKRFEHDGDVQWADRAREVCEKAVQIDEDLSEGHLCLADVHRGHGDFGEAKAHYGWAMSLEPTLEAAYRGLAGVYEQMEDPAAAEEVYRKAISVRPHDRAAYRWLGAFYASEGHHEASVEMFRKVAELTPGSYRAHADLGRSLLTQRRFKEAIPVLRRSIEIKGSVEVYPDLATAYMRVGRYAESIPVLKEAIRMAPNDHVLQGHLGHAYLGAGSQDQALTAYRRAVRIALKSLEADPSDASTRIDLAKYHAMLGQVEDAEKQLERALKSARVNEGLLLEAEKVYKELGSSDKVPTTPRP